MKTAVSRQVKTDIDKREKNNQIRRCMIEKAFGIIPLKQSKNGWQVFLVKKKEGHVGFPKGHGMLGEGPQKTAERELFEETGLYIAKYVTLQPLIEKYSFRKEGSRIDKQVDYYLAEVEGDIVLDNQEIVEGRWSSLNEAMDQITFAEGRSLAAKIEALLPKAEPI